MRDGLIFTVNTAVVSFLAGSETNTYLVVKDVNPCNTSVFFDCEIGGVQ